MTIGILKVRIEVEVTYGLIKMKQTLWNETETDFEPGGRAHWALDLTCL